MLSVEDARARILDPLRPTGPEIIPLAESLGRVLAAPVLARLTQPPADVSAMDGYALRAADTGPRQVIGAAPAGHPFAGTVGPGQAVRLFTGSVVPPGSDSVLAQEDADRTGDTMLPTDQPIPGRHIRRAGQDFAMGDTLLAPGTRLGPRAIGLAAAANHPWLTVHRRPRVAILATGDEIAMPGDPLAPGGIVSSNAHALAALVRQAGAEPTILPIAADQPAALTASLDSLGPIDLLITTGGASVGDHDLVQSAFAERGFELDFWQIAMRPGKPLLFGRLGTTPVLGLPGNPVSALICGLVFVAPALARLSGMPDTAPRVTRARLGAPLAANDHRADHLRATLDGDVATAFARQDSSLLRTLSQADALILRPPHAPALPAGAEVEIIRLDSWGY